MLSYVLTFLEVRNNQFIGHLFDLMAVVFFTVIYYRAFHESLFKKLALIFGSATLVIIICNTIFIEGLTAYPSISNTVLCLLMIILSLTYFYQLLTRQEFIHIDKQGLFWINAGALFYFSVNIFFFMIFNKISSSAQADFIMIQSVTNIIANLLFSAGLLCKPQKTASSRY